jgi:hypothetical protein
MSVGSIGLVPVPVVANEYNAPKLKVNKKGQITYIEDINDEGQLDNLQEVYDEYEADYQALLQAQADIQADIDAGNALITTNDTTLDTQEGIMTQDDTDLTALIDSFVPFEYDEYSIMSSQLSTSTPFLFSNITLIPTQQEAQTIPITNTISVPAGSYLVSGFLMGDVIEDGDLNRIDNAGSGMILNIINNTTGATICRFCSGRTGNAFDEEQFSRGQVCGQQFVTLTDTAEIGLTFYCFAGAVEGQGGFSQISLEWLVQPFSTIGSGTSGDAGATNPPTEYYKVVSFQKI